MTSISLKEFLKMYTGISNKFIDEYYKFYELCEKNMFGIDSIKVIKYLKIKYARAFHENLRTNYILNRDYVIQRIHQKSQKDKQDVFYYLSFAGYLFKSCSYSYYKEYFFDKYKISLINFFYNKYVDTNKSYLDKKNYPKDLLKFIQYYY